mgnify:CR=1 FL=1
MTIRATILRLFGYGPEPERHVYLEGRSRTGRFKYRGKLGPRDDPEGFARMMAEHDLRVIVADTFRGTEITDKDAKIIPIMPR